MVTQKPHTVFPVHRLGASQNNIGIYVVTMEPATTCRLEVKCSPWLQSSFLQAFIDESGLSMLLCLMRRSIVRRLQFEDVPVFLLKA